MKTSIERKSAKGRRMAVPATAVPDGKPVPVAIVPRLVKRGACPTLNLKGELAYEIGVDSRGDVHLRVVENSGTGSFSDDWVGLRSIQAAFDRAPKSEPVSAYMLYPLFRGLSSNCPYFLTAVLKSEGLLQPSEKRKKRFDRVDPTAWLTEMKNRTEGPGGEVKADRNNKRPATTKAGASKPKKSNKAAKT